MIIRTCLRLFLLTLPALMLLAIVAASAATNSITGSSLGARHLSVAPDDVKPQACAAQDIERLISGTGVISGTSDNDLILGSSGADVISGEGGDDCIVGGGGADTLLGSSGDDTCIGGSGIDVLALSCERQEQ
jgi:Ca2+-binding RTX toxin-like protein